MSEQSVKTKSFWNRAGAGESYDKEFSGQIGWYVNESEIRPFQDLIRSVSGIKILDVGCGTGRYLKLFNPNNDLNGLDLSEQMLVQARAKVPQAKFTAGSAETLPFPDASFDMVMSVRMLQHMPDQKKVIQEMARVCRPGGRVVLISYNTWSFLCLYKQLRLSRLAKILNIPLKPLLRQRSFLNPWGFTYDNYCSMNELCGWLKGMGFSIETTWGATLGQPWFWNDFFIGKILEKMAPFLLRPLIALFLFLDATLARCFPFKYFTDKNIVVGIKGK